MARTHPPIDGATNKRVDMKFTLPAALKEALKQKSAEEGVSRQALVRRLLASEVMDGEQHGAA